MRVSQDVEIQAVMNSTQVGDGGSSSVMVDLDIGRSALACKDFMNHAQISDADLRLLRVLDSLLTTRHVARTAEIFEVSPSAISHSLKLLRKKLDDPLLVRSNGKLQPTPLATSLQSNLRAGLLQLSGVLSQKLIFDPATSTRTMSIAAPDHPLFTMLPPLVGRLRKIAPHLTIALRSIGPTVLDDMTEGSLDVVLAGDDIAAMLALDRNLMRSRVLAEPFLCVMRPDHPAAKTDPVDLDAYLKASHVLVSASTGERGSADDFLALAGYHRKVAATVPSLLTAAWIAAEADLIATLPEMVAKRAVERGGAVARRPPIEMPESLVYMWWRPRFQGDPAHVWWRQTLVDAFTRNR
jgi:DNA-binding transcriptional LysR family regulator